ncbi:MAG TPA: hypothetical protein VEB60_02570 [Candidatus Paceibacterota bacterium]|nr:hypothetical protein [Candidatus Paceibacterota bacterium]
MNLLSYFLAKYQNLVPPDDFLKEATADVIFRVIGKPLDKKMLSVRNNKIYVKAPPAVKNQIFLHKQRILRTLMAELDKKAPQDIL